MKKDKLLSSLNEKDFASAPIRELIKHLYMQVLQTQILEIESKTEMAKVNRKLTAIEKALSSSTFIRSGFLTLRYNSRTSEIIASEHYQIDFSNTIESDLLKIMFFSKSGKPKSTKWYTSEVAESFKNKGNEALNSQRKVYKVAHRIKTRLNKELKADVLCVRGKEFFWLNTN